MMKSKRDKKAKKNKNKGEFESYEDIDWESLGNKKKNKKKKKHSGTKVVKVVHVSLTWKTKFWQKVEILAKN